MKPHILVVEDEDALVDPAALQPREGRASASSVAADGEEALPRSQEDEPDLVLLDWMLPQLSGIEVCRQLRRRADDRATCRSSC